MRAKTAYTHLWRRRFRRRSRIAFTRPRHVHVVGRTTKGHRRIHGPLRRAAGGRPINFSLSTRPILAETDDKAWDRAREILSKITERTGGGANPKNRAAENVGSQRLLAAAADAEVHDTCLYTALAAATGARGNSTALVGTPDTVRKRCSTTTSSVRPAYSRLRSTPRCGAVRTGTNSKGPRTCGCL